jgi:site-specific recombinase XerD
MAAKIKFFVTNPKGKTKSKKKIERINILVRFSNGRQFDLIAKSRKEIKPDYWNNEKSIVRDIAEFEEKDDFQKSLNKLEQHIIKEYDNTLDKSKINRDWLNKTIDKLYNPDKYLPENMSLFNFIKHHFIDNVDKRTNPDTGQSINYRTKLEYANTFNLLKKYAQEYGEPDFIDIDLEFYNNFINFLKHQKVIIRDKDGNIVKEKYLAVNTRGKKIRTLKVFLNAATEKGINKHMKYKSRKFKAISEEAENIYLTKEELKKFYEHDFSKKTYLERVRDIFVVAAWTGVRYSDIQQIRPERITDNIFTIKQQKTGGKAVIPINGIVWNIINKYNGKLPKPISNQKFNDYLKEAARTAELNSVFIKTENINGMRIEKKYPKHEVISTHTARRSFCTNAYKDGIPSLSIMAISGHKTEKAFLKYIKVDGEEHAKKVLEMWQKNGEFMKVVK